MAGYKDVPKPLCIKQKWQNIDLPSSHIGLINWFSQCSHNGFPIFLFHPVTLLDLDVFQIVKENLAGVNVIH